MTVDGHGPKTKNKIIKRHSKIFIHVQLLRFVAVIISVMFTKFWSNSVSHIYPGKLINLKLFFMSTLFKRSLIKVVESTFY